MQPRRFTAALAVTVAALTVALAPSAAHAQGKGKGLKHYAVSSDRAVVVTRNALIRRGYDVVRIERVGVTQVVYYRAGNNGRGKGKGRLERMVIRRVDRRVVFEQAPPAVMVDIDVDLRL